VSHSVAVVVSSTEDCASIRGGEGTVEAQWAVTEPAGDSPPIESNTSPFSPSPKISAQSAKLHLLAISASHPPTSSSTTSAVA